MEENLQESEVETLDWQETAETTETPEPKLYTEEEVESIRKKMQSDSDKWVQPLIKKTKVYDIVLDEIGKVADRNERLVELYNENEEAAKIILDKYYSWMDIEDFKESIQYQEDLTDPKVFERKVSTETQKRLDKKTIEKSKSDFIEKLQMTEDEAKDFEDEFSLRTSLKGFKIEDLDTHLEKAYRSISNQDNQKELKTQEVIAKAMVTWEWKWWSGWMKTQSNEVVDFLQRMWIVQ